jgi:hypothetical protein
VRGATDDFIISEKSSLTMHIMLPHKNSAFVPNANFERINQFSTSSLAAAGNNADERVCN